MDSATNVEEAVTLADRLRAIITAEDSLDALWDQPAAREAYDLTRQAGFDPEEFLSDAADTMNMAIPDPIRRFFHAYARQVHASICKPGGDLRAKVDAATGSGTAAVLVCLGTALAIPPAAVTLVAPIAAILLVKGVDAFCGMNRDRPAPP